MHKNWSTILHLFVIDPLTSFEISSTSKAIKEAYSGQDFMFIRIELKEPSKEIYLPYFLADENPPKGSIHREAAAILLDLATGLLYEATVRLCNKENPTIISWTQLPPGTFPGLANGETSIIRQIVLADSKVKSRLSKYGKEFADVNSSLVVPDVWLYGFPIEDQALKGKRLAQVYFFVKFFEKDNFYAHPLGFVAIFDMLERSVLGIEELPIQTGFDTKDRRGEKVPNILDNFDPNVSGISYRMDVSHITIAQENGPSFQVEGYLVLWQKWKMRLGWNSREGLFLHNVGYYDNGLFRPILYRASLVTVFVPYGDPRPPFHRKMPFDATWLGMGFVATELRSPDICRGSVYFKDFVVNDMFGNPVIRKNSVCIYEEDVGILWRKKDPDTGRELTARSQRLVLTFISAMGNYDYQFKWLFYQDASIKVEVTLNGIVTQNMLSAKGSPGGHGMLVVPQSYAQYHQHEFVFRLDTEIDGNKNTAAIMDVVADSKSLTKSNPYGTGFHDSSTILKTVSQARTNARAESARVWKIMGEPGNDHPINGNRRAWKLIPEFRSARPFITKDSPVHYKAAFTDFDFWVTRFHDEQIYPGGKYLNSSGIADWVADNPNASIENTDIVLWHILGFTHIIRAEDTPVMPSETVGFWFKPCDFFLENPAIDVYPYIR